MADRLTAENFDRLSSYEDSYGDSADSSRTLVSVTGSGCLVSAAGGGAYRVTVDIDGQSFEYPPPDLHGHLGDSGGQDMGVVHLPPIRLNFSGTYTQDGDKVTLKFNNTDITLSAVPLAPPRAERRGHSREARAAAADSSVGSGAASREEVAP